MSSTEPPPLHALLYLQTSKQLKRKGHVQALIFCVKVNLVFFSFTVAKGHSSRDAKLGNPRKEVNLANRAFN